MGKRIPTRERRGPSRFFSRLSSAFYELVLIVLLYIQALLSYVVQKFARYCKLPMPCMLCSRLDRKKPYFYKDLMCDAHKIEISPLVYCRSHKKLVDAHGMCDGCLLSFLGEIRAIPKPVSISRRCCSCCSAPVKNISTAHRLLQSKHLTVSDVSLSGSGPRNGSPKGSENCSKSLVGDHCCKRTSHTVGYNQLRFASDTESEAPIADEADGRTFTRVISDVKEELLSRCLQAGPGADIPNNSTEVTSEDKITEKMIQSSTIDIGHGLEEIIWGQVEVKPNVLVSSEITLEQTPSEASVAKLEIPDKSCIALNGDASKGLSSADLCLRTNQIVNEKLSSGLKTPSAASAEFGAVRESSRVPEDLKARLSQMPPARWLDLPWNEMSATPRGNGQCDESKYSDTSSSSALTSHARRLIVDRYESGMDCFDGSFINEIEGEGAVDRLKRQIEMDRKCMSVLYKELEEERNAAEIAASQAMAMINRLQEEKASMQMEALQYLRLMEEQTEYDQEALQKLDDILSDREKEIQDLEVLVDSYRKQFGGEPQVSGECEEREYTEYTPVSTPRFMRSRGREVGKTLTRNTMLDFEDEKAYISESLKKLERKLRLVSNNGAYTIGSEVSLENTPRKKSILGDTMFKNGDEYPKPAVDDDQTLQENSQKAENEKSTPIEDPQVNTISTPSRHACNFSFKDALRESRSRSASYNERHLRMGGKRNDIADLGYEISQLSVRLEAVEEDRSFLEHAISSLSNGSSGVQFLQEIACHLRELRKIGTTS